MAKFLVIPFVLVGAALTGQAADNQLTPAEKKAGWKLLFDGKSFQNWRDPATEVPPGDSWIIEDGCLTTVPKPHISEDLISAKDYGDFELAFEWRVSPGANTGVKYRIQRTVFLDSSKGEQGGFEASTEREMKSPAADRASLAPSSHGQEYTVAFEFQLIDDERHPDAKKDANHVTGALYSMLAPSKRPAHPAGEWNQGRLILKGNHVEHWINGEQVLSASLDDRHGLANLNKRWENGPAVYEILAHAKQTGPFSLQHHGDKVWFKNIKIKAL
ncbi:MAG: DUF1080 domain-containing protein [Acidobacteriota bacterium]|nr:DUF1080 domain-containing protein [Acidobacteriota bacterium]